MTLILLSSIMLLNILLTVIVFVVFDGSESKLLSKRFHTGTNRKQSRRITPCLEKGGMFNSTDR